jgi:hypothetical protein
VGFAFIAPISSDNPWIRPFSRWTSAAKEASMGGPVAPGDGGIGSLDAVPGLSRWGRWIVQGPRTTEADMPAKTANKVKVLKRDVMLKMLRSNKGATVSQMQRATGWQPHSIRGFLSGTVKKKLGLTFKSEVGSDGDRRYSVTAR